MAFEIENMPSLMALIQANRKIYLELQDKAVQIFYSSFPNSMPKNLIEKALENLRKNEERKYKFRANEVPYPMWIFELKDAFYDAAMPIYNLDLLPKENTIAELMRSGFHEHHSNKILGWGEHIELRDEIFERYVCNDGKEAKNYYFYGGLGVGKTTLLTAIARMLLKILDIKINFVTMPQLTKIITSISENDKSEIEKLKRVPFLFADDIGQEKYTTDNQESMMRDFFVHRYSNNLPTFFAGNMDIRKKKSKGLFYTQLSDYMNDRKQFRIEEIKGESHRR